MTEQTMNDPRWITRLKSLGLWQRLGALYVLMLTLAGLYVALQGGAFALVFGSLTLGIAIGAISHHFRPYSHQWSGWKSALVRSLNGVACISIVYMALWGRFVEYGALAEEGVSWLERVSGFVLVGVGMILAAMVLGKGRFEPHQKS